MLTGNDQPHLIASAALLAGASVLAMALLVSGAGEAGRGESSLPEAESPAAVVGLPESLMEPPAPLHESGKVVHLVAVVERVNDSGRVLPVRVEIWQDRDSGKTRRTTTLIDHRGDGLPQQDELIADGVWSILQADTGADARADARARWFNLLRYDAPSGERQAPERLYVTADPEDARSAFETGTPEYVGQETLDDRATEVIRWSSGGDDRGLETTIHLDPRSLRPLRVETYDWFLTPEGKRATNERGSITWETQEAVPRAEVPAGTFELDIPEGIETITSLSLDRAEAASLDEIVVYGVGDRWGELRASTEYHYSSAGTRMRASVGMRRGGPGAASAAQPRLSRSDVGVIYSGADSGPVLGVVSLPRVEPKEWDALIGDRPKTRTEIGGRPALRLTGGWSSDLSGTRVSETYHYLVVDRPDATVVLWGYSLGPDDLDDAAARLAPVR